MSLTKIHGQTHKYGDNVNTDMISPAQYMEYSNDVIAAHAMEGLDPEFPQKVKAGDIIVAGKNFGSGSSRETAPIAIKGIGIGAVVAEFFARIFYRNCINIGLPVFICPNASEICDGDELEIIPEDGLIRDLTTHSEYHCEALPPEVMQMVACGGLLPYLEKKLAEAGEDAEAADVP